jgi:HD-GYP domain-containing protein (c-di-GMP phosphodiesterase class II)
MNHTIPNIRIARELAARLESVFGAQPLLITMSPKGLKVDCEDGKSVDWDSGEEIARFDRTWVAFALGQMTLELQRSYATSHDGRLQLLMHLSQDIKNPILLYLDLVGHSELIVRSLVEANIEALWYREDAKASKNQIESFIDQVTQDFEELSWLRNANEYLDLCDAKHPLQSIASACLPDLAQVIRAQAILYVPVAACKIDNLAKVDANQIFATGPSDAALSVCTQFISESIDGLNGGPLVLNTNSFQQNLPGYEGIRNCILVPITKGAKTYGWLFAVNKTPPNTHQDHLCAGVKKLTGASFGTFEASLLVAASNIMSAQARNLDFFESQELLLTGVVRAIINAIDAKDTYTCGHSDRVASYAKRIAKRLGLSDDECERVFMAGVLHDVGKIGVPDAILSKPGKLTDFEYEIVKQHPRIGFEILEHLKQLNYVLPGVLHHHEAYNGSGYPSGLAGEDIPLHGRILAVADAYDAMTSNRPYRSGMPHEKAEAILRAEAGKTWDARIVDVFLACLAQEPVPHLAESAQVPICPSGNSYAPDTQSNTHLMWRISNSINNMTAN